MRVLRRGSAILVAGAGNREVARCDGGDISWQAQYFVRVRRVYTESFVQVQGVVRLRVVVEVNVDVKLLVCFRLQAGVFCCSSKQRV